MMDSLGTSRTEPGAGSPHRAVLIDPDEIPLSYLVHVFRRYAFALAVVVSACTGAVLLTSYLVPKWYTASTTLSLVPQSSATDEGAIGSITTRVSAMASVNLNSDPKKIESLVKLQSTMLLERYIRKNDLLPILFPQKTVSIADASDYFNKNIRKVISDPKSGFVDLTVSWKDPILAADWANGLVAMANDMERETAQTRSRQTIAYLTDQVEKTNDVVTKQTLNSLIASELKQSLVAQGTREFGFRVVDRAVVPERYSYPNKMTWLITACVGSFSIATFVLFCLVAWRRNSHVTHSRGA